MALTEMQNKHKYIRNDRVPKMPQIFPAQHKPLEGEAGKVHVMMEYDKTSMEMKFRELSEHEMPQYYVVAAEESRLRKMLHVLKEHNP